MIEYRKGGRRIELFLPIEYRGATITEIVLRPFTIGDELRWYSGRFGSAIELLAHVSGLDEAAIEKLAYPDAGFVIEAFMAYLPGPISQAIVDRKTPAGTGSSTGSSVPRDDEEERRMAEQFGPDWREAQPAVPTSYAPDEGAEQHPHIPDFPEV